MQDPKDVEKARKIAPAVAELTAKLEAEGLQYSALIFDSEGSFLIRAGNSEHKGSDFVRLHYFLAMVIAQLDEMGEARDLSVFTPSAGSQSQGPEEIALRLAQMVLTVPVELVPERIRTAAAEYLISVGE
jgi:hypothetical protein